MAAFLQAMPKDIQWSVAQEGEETFVASCRGVTRVFKDTHNALLWIADEAGISDQL